MEVFVSILYTQRFKRPLFFGLFGMPRLELELVGISLALENSDLSLFNSEHRLGTKDQYNDAGIFTLVPTSGYPRWTRYADIVEQVAHFLGLGEGTRKLIVVTNGDPHQEAFMAKILAETQREVSVSFRSVEQRLEEAATWLPTRCYGMMGNFTRYVMKEEGKAFDQDDRKLMFCSHMEYPFDGQTIHLQDRANHLYKVYSAINSIMTAELSEERQQEDEQWGVL